MSHQNPQTAFAPQLIVHDGAAAIEFYKNAFDVTELRRWNNDDGTVHVAELSFQGALFHIRQESAGQSKLSPATAGVSTAIIGIFVKDVDSVIDRAIAQGAGLISPAQDYEYGYRQGSVKDPFGHHWLIEMSI